MAEFLIKELIAVSYKLRIGTGTITKMIENTRKSMVVDSHMTFVSKPPDDVVIDWYLATLDPDKDINYFYHVYKRVKPYLVPSINTSQSKQLLTNQKMSSNNEIMK